MDADNLHVNYKELLFLYWLDKNDIDAADDDIDAAGADAATFNMDDDTSGFY